MKKGKIFILSGPSGSGKTTLYKKLLAETKDLVKSVSVTTREMRPGEKNGRDYIFVSKKMFNYKRTAGHFLESMKVYDNFYGTPAKGVRELLKSGKNVLLCIDVKGAKVVRRAFPEAITIFIKTPTFAVLKKRLADRETENSETAAVRLRAAKEELREANTYKHVVINDRLDHAFNQLNLIVATELREKLT